MEKKDIKGYLHLYLGCKCTMIDGDMQERKFTLNAYNLNYYRQWSSSLKPILRQISSLTDEEIEYLCENIHVRDGHFIREDWSNKDIREAYTELWDRFTPNEFQYLLSIGIDLFNLIESGLALDSDTLNPVKK